MIVLLESAVEASLIVGAALAVLPLLRRRSAALRHWVLAASIFCAAAAPVLGAMMPVWRLPVEVLTDTAPAGPGGTATPSTVPLDAGGDPSRAVRRTDAPTSRIMSLLFWAWTAGLAVSLGVLLAGLVRLRVIARRARPVTDARWLARAAAIRAEQGIRRPLALLECGTPPLLVTWGIVRPKLAIPVQATRWDEQRIDVVLRHELAHIRRGDWPIQLAAEVLRSIYWFNPLLWLACVRLRQEAERACDDAVIDRGVEGAEYAAHLVDIAREFSARRNWAAAPAMARASSLEGRVTAMLDRRLKRGPLSGTARAATLVALLAIAAPIAGFAAQTVFSSVGGSIVDPTNGVLPGVTLVLTNVQTKAKLEVTSDASGRYEFIGVPAGDYTFEAKLPGFATVRGTLTVSGQNIQRDLQLQVGSLQETITIAMSRAAAAAGAVEPPPAPTPARAKRTNPPCRQPAAGDAVVRVGGNIRPPHKVKDVRPIYPLHLAAQGVSGAVVLQATIAPDGSVDRIEVVSAPHADLGAAAATAVKQWEFDSTLLNCVAIPVSMTVRVNFTLKD